MKLQKLIISNFLSYGPDPIEIKFSDYTTIIGPNGVGKSNILRSLRLLLQFEDYSNTAYFKELSGINNAHPNLDIRFYFDLSQNEIQLISNYIYFLILGGMSKKPSNDPNSIMLNDLRSLIIKPLKIELEQIFTSLVIILQTNQDDTERIFRTSCVEINGELIEIGYDGFNKLDFNKSSSYNSKSYLTCLIEELINIEENEEFPIQNKVMPAFYDLIQKIDVLKFKDNFQSSNIREVQEIFRNYELYIDKLNRLRITKYSGLENTSINRLINYILKNTIIILPEHRGLLEDRSKDNDGETELSLKTLANLLFQLKMGKIKEKRKRFEEIQKLFRDMMKMDIDISVEEKSEVISDIEGKIFLDKEKIASKYGDHTKDEKFATFGLQTINYTLPTLEIDIIFRQIDSKDSEWFGLNHAPGGAYELLLVLTASVGITNKLILLDEPGRTLHPILQIKLREQIAKRFISNDEISTQIILITHSPYLINIENLENIIRLSKKFNSTSTHSLMKINEKSIETNLKLQQFIKNVNGEKVFFAKGIIIVEGITEVILLEELDKLEEINLEISKEGWEVLNLDGKNNLYKGILIAILLDLPWCAILDFDALVENDKNKYNNNTIFKDCTIGWTHQQMGDHEDILASDLFSTNVNQTREFLKGEDNIENRKLRIKLKDSINKLLPNIFVFTQDGIEKVINKQIDGIQFSKNDIKISKIRKVTELLIHQKNNEIQDMIEFINNHISL
ncbi:MAG: Chromosome partition protein Smc [Candidatus Heimdallarchaeota archaeon LC_2]|nr:MAG: Chromosome partition protein Smc [Candidatus Heimdallarchaeota archaeon LC_2]